MPQVRNQETLLIDPDREEKLSSSHCPLKPIIFPLQVQRFIFSQNVSIVSSIFPVACPFTGKFTVELCNVTIPVSDFHDDLI